MTKVARSKAACAHISMNSRPVILKIVPYTRPTIGLIFVSNGQLHREDLVVSKISLLLARICFRIFKL